jgi:hypothetical protein
MYGLPEMGKHASWLERLFLGRRHCVGEGSDKVRWTFTGDAVFRLVYCLSEWYLELATNSVSYEVVDGVVYILDG